ncbi:ribonuclease H family protein, partial [Actinobacillus pleuropneumoniae]|uniref:ribonuclease H family protein n=1 Tax=Actinobacillus pleuropneumoniae TaxID=715 RepID=UPI00227BBDB2
MWTDECETTFVKIKEIFCKAPILHGPDWNLLFHISTNASHTIVGVVLGQQEDKKPYVIYYVNKNLTPTKLNYAVI